MAFLPLSLMQLLSLLATFLSVAHSLPTIERRCFIFGCGDKTPHHTKIGVSEETLYNFRLLSQYSAAAYCEENNNSTGTPVTCHTGACAMVEATNATSYLEFEDSKMYDNTGYVAIDKFHKLVVLSFRGSVSKANWRADYSLIRVHTDLCHKCKVHMGFWKAWSQIKKNTLATVKAVMNQHPGYQLAVTGHSLGGAMATLAAAEIRKTSEGYANKTLLVTFGSPRIGNRRTADFLTKQSRHSFRVTAGDDPIPRMPFHALGYFHMSPEYWIRRNAQNPDAGDIHWITGLYNEAGNSGAGGLSHFGKDSHRHYFGNISYCRPKHDSSKRRRSEIFALPPF